MLRRASLGRVLENGKADAMPIQKYDVRQPVERGGQFESRYWSPSNVPVFDAQNRICYIIHKVVDVTDLGLDRLDDQGRSRLDPDPIALPFPLR